MQAELAREKQVRQAELDERQRKQLNDERFKLGRLAQMQLQNGPVRPPAGCAPLFAPRAGAVGRVAALQRGQLRSLGGLAAVLGLAPRHPACSALLLRAVEAWSADCLCRCYVLLQDGKTLLQYLLERHGLRGLKVYRNKDAGKLAAMAAAEQRRRAMGGTQRDARGVALAPLPQHRAQAQRAG